MYFYCVIVFRHKGDVVNGFNFRHRISYRLEIRELVDAYAHCADRRDAKGQMSLFTKDTRFVVFMDAGSENPSIELNRREDLAPVFDELNKYEVTTHFMGKGTVVLRWRTCNWRNLLHCPSCVCI